MNDPAGGLYISADQLLERDQWEQRLALGQCTLEEALIMVLHIGAPAGPYLVERIVKAFGDYSTGAFLADGEKSLASLAAAFGSTKGGNEGQKYEKEMFNRSIYELVNHEHERYAKGHPKHAPLNTSDSRTTMDGATAFSIAATIFNLAESTVKNRYYRHRDSVTGAS